MISETRAPDGSMRPGEVVDHPSRTALPILQAEFQPPTKTKQDTDSTTQLEVEAKETCQRTPVCVCASDGSLTLCFQSTLNALRVGLSNFLIWSGLRATYKAHLKVVNNLEQ